MKERSRIELSQFGSWFLSRQYAKIVAKSLEEMSQTNQSIDLDLSKITFMSRSFADELIKSISNSKAEVSIVNANKFIYSMLKAMQYNSFRRRAITSKNYPQFIAESTDDYFKKLGI